MSVREELKSFGAVSLSTGLVVAVPAAMIFRSGSGFPLGTALVLFPLASVAVFFALSYVARLLVAASERDLRETREQMARVRAAIDAMSIPEARAFVEDRIQRRAVERAPWTPGHPHEHTAAVPVFHGMFDNAQSLTVVSSGWSMDATLDTPEGTPPGWRLLADFEGHEQVWVNMKTGNVAVAFDCALDEVPAQDHLPSLWHVLAERLLEEEDRQASPESARAGEP